MNKDIIKLDAKYKASVSQLENKNQFVINYDDVVVFQSYRTLIAVWSYSEHKLYINWCYWDYSKTTMKHLKIFINDYTSMRYENKQQFMKFIISNDKVVLFE